MIPLFDVADFEREQDAPAARRDRKRPDPQQQAAPVAIAPITYWIRGSFRFGDGQERTRTVQGHSLRHRVDDDARRFAAYLAEEGWLFPEGRAVLVDLLGIGADDGTTMLMAMPQHETS